MRGSVSLLRVHHSGRRIDFVASICISAVEVGALPQAQDTPTISRRNSSERSWPTINPVAPKGCGPEDG